MSKQMTVEEAIASLNASLRYGDEVMKSHSWSGGNFRSQAIRVVLAELERLMPKTSV